MDKFKKVSKVNVTPPVEDYTKWVSIIAAGSALGLGIFALKEIRNAKKELINLKTNDKLEKKMENLEIQLKSINDFIKGNVPVPKPIQRNVNAPNAPPNANTPKVNIIKKEKLTPIPVETEKIIIVNENYNPDEYEEVEVTDSEDEE
jgi:hypothetical protein